MPTAAAESATAQRQHIDVHSPFDGRVVAQVRRASADDVRAAVSAASEVSSCPLAAHERAAILDRAAALVRERRDELASTIVDEAGKPATAARLEVDRAVDTLTFCALEARSLAGEVVPMDASASGEGKLAVTLRRPVGVVAAITPFNFPLNLSCHKVGPAIAAGCAVVHKPASQTPSSALQLRQLFEDAGLPQGWYEVVCGSGSDVGAALTRDDRVAMITFTGSSEVGWKLREQAPRKRVRLELGNSTPLIVCDDADISSAAKLIAKHGYTHAGQSCISIQRVIAQQPVYDELCELLAREVSELAVGDPADEATHVGPLIDHHAAERVAAWIGEARDEGARVVCGGNLDAPFVQPAVVADVQPQMRVFRDELFGPAVAVTPFADDAEAVDLANATEYGLQAGVLTNDISRALSVVPALRFGGVSINEAPTFRADQMPYGGIKDSGNTREGPRYAVREMTEQMLVIVNT